MRSPTSSEDSRLVRIVVPCAQMRLPGPRGHRDAFSSSSEQRKHCAFRQAFSVGHRASSEARGDVCSSSWSGGRFDAGSSGVRTLPLHGEFDQLLLPAVRGVVFICACALY